MQALLQHSKFSRNQAKHATCCNYALACASQSSLWCHGAGSLPPTKHKGLGWQKSSRLPALQVIVFQPWLCRPVCFATLQKRKLRRAADRWLKSADTDLLWGKCFRLCKLKNPGRSSLLNLGQRALHALPAVRTLQQGSALSTGSSAPEGGCVLPGIHPAHR